MSEKHELIVCLGSSCFSRGNNKVLPMIKEYLQEKNLIDQVFFHGELCTGNCSKGPIINIDNILYEGVSEENIVEILDSHFFN